MKLLSGLIVAVAGVGAPAIALDIPPLTAVEVAIRVHDSGKFGRFYPEKAQRAGLEGRASALCVIAANGDLTDCTASGETPEGYGFAEATVRLATAMRAAPKARDGSATVGRQFRFDMNFKLPR